MARENAGVFFITHEMNEAGLLKENVEQSLFYTHKILDQIDEKLLEVDADRISQMVELANLSSMVGNLMGAALAKFSNGKLIRNGPHKYPDLIAVAADVKDIEIKVALENNKPKGHLAKEGYYMTCRYILANEERKFLSGDRGKIVEIWEIRFGYLLEEHFNLSNTPGDSGKTAVINKDGMEALKIVYLNLEACPLAIKGRTFKSLQDIINSKL